LAIGVDAQGLIILSKYA